MTTIPARMTAIEIACAGGPEVLRAVERPVPQPTSGEVLVQVEGAGVKGDAVGHGRLLARLFGKGKSAGEARPKFASAAATKNRQGP